MKASRWGSAMLASLLCVVSPFVYAQDMLWRFVVQKDAETTTGRHTALLSNGDWIVGGQTGTMNNVRDFIVFRIAASDGAVTWSRRFDCGGTGENINDLIVDPATNTIYVAGRSSVTGQALNWCVMKFNADGTNAWTSAYTYNHTQNANDEPRALALVQDGATKNLAVVGQISTTSGTGGRVVKLNASTGALLWAVNHEAQFQQYWNVDTASNGDIYAVGDTNGSNACIVTKFNVAGTQLWSVSSTGPGATGLHNFSNAVIEPTSGDLIASGFAQGSGNNNDISIARFKSSDGTRLWHTLINGPANLADGGQAISLDSTHAYIGTGIYRVGSTGSDWFIARLSLSNGLYDAANNGWSATFTGDDATSNDQLSALKVIGSTVYASGGLRDITPGRVLTTLKLNATTGATINRTSFRDRIGPQQVGFKSMQITSSGDMLIAGNWCG